MYKLLRLLIFVISIAFGGLILNAKLSGNEQLSDTTLALQEISVTAIKQSSNIRVQPIAATIVDTKQLERLNIVAMKNISEIAPNFYMPDYGSRMTSSIYVRGLGARIDQPVVGLSVDNVPFLNKDNYDFDIVDIERIEVLRGPQSTLYGRNTMGGQINVYTLSPMRYQGMRFMAEYGSGNTIKASIADYRKYLSNLAMSWTAYYRMSDGFFDNKYNEDDCDTEKQFSFRWKTLWRISDHVNMENVAGAQISRQGGYPYRSIETDEINYNDTCFYRRTGITDGLTIKWLHDKFTLSSISSFQYIDDNMTLDQDFMPLDYFTLTQKRREWAVTQDLVARGSVGKYRWLGGLFGFYKNMNMKAPVTFKDYGIDQLIEKHRNEANPYYPIGWDDDTFVINSNFKMPTWGIAVYHQSSYVIGQWKLSADIRFDYEHTSLNYHSSCNTSYTIYDCTQNAELSEPYKNQEVAIDDFGRLSKSFCEVLPKLSLMYELPTVKPSNIYLSVSKGYKSGGYNTQMFSDVLQQRIMGLMGLSMKYNIEDVIEYNPEKSINYELGAHLSSNDGKLIADAALFYIDCRDQQLTMFPEGTTTGRIMANAGKTRSYGFELSTIYRVSEDLELNASYGFTDARFVKFDNGIKNYEGKRIPYAPRNTLFARISYSLPVKSKVIDALKFNVNCRGVGPIYWDEENEVKQSFYALLGASLRLERREFSLDVWGENLTDTNYKSFYFVSIGHGFYQQGKPASVGVTLRVNFESK